MESASVDQSLVAIQTAFKMFDRDGDGKISAPEFKAVMGSLVEKITDAEVDTMFRGADKDGDSAISFDEFHELLLPHHSKPLVFGKFVGEKVPGETRRLRNSLLRDDEDLVSSFRGMKTLKDVFDKNSKEVPDKPFLGSRAKTVGENGTVTYGEYQWKTFAQVREAAHSVASYLMKHELAPKVTNEEGTFRFISIYAKNREEWVMTDFGAMIAAITTVTLYDTLGHESIDYILDQTSMKTVFCSADKIKNLVDLKANGKIQTVTHIFYYDDAKAADLEAGAAAGLTITSFSTVLEEGKTIVDDGSSWDPVTPDTKYTFSYTSGTTGVPKGVMLTHQNFISSAGGLDFFHDEDRYNDTDVYISYLPLAHVFERLILLTCMGVKIQVGFY